MRRLNATRRSAIVMSVLLAGMLLMWCPLAVALNPALDVSEYVHTSWKVRDGFTKGTISAIAQTTDGYLWLGTEFGLVRFDGVKPVPWQPSSDQHLPSSRIFSLVAARDGTLWIGTTKGLASWRSGNLVTYPELAGQSIRAAILEDHEGTIWAGGLASSSPGKLCAIRSAGIQCFGEDGALGNGVSGIYEDRNFNLWVGVRNGVWRWKPGPPKFFPAAAPTANGGGIQGLSEGDDGALRLGPHTGIDRLFAEKVAADPLPGISQEFTTLRLLRDREGSLWIGTSDKGLIHEHGGKVDLFSQADGLSGDFITALFSDREGTVWVATDAGLDRFREAAAAIVSLNQGLSNASVLSILAGRDGSVWLATRRGLNRWKDGRISVFGQPTVQSVPDRRENAGDNRDPTFNRTYPGSLFEDSRGRIWVSTIRDFGYLEGDRFVPLKSVPGGVVYSIAEDAAQNLWIANKDLGLIQLRSDGTVQPTPWAALGHKDPAMALAPDPLQHGLWIGFNQGGVAYFAEGAVRASYSADAGLGAGRVNDLRIDPDGTLWAGTEGGLSRLKNGRVATLNSSNGLPCDSIHWSQQDNAGSLWLYTTCGLLRIARPELNAWTTAADADKNTRHTVRATVFDSSDGVRSLEDVGGYTPHVARSADGKLWFLPSDGASVVDPRHLPFNHLPPPVRIEQITADRKTFNLPDSKSQSLHLSAGVRDLQIDYTALSLVAPEKVRFRYKLEDWDKEWQEVGSRRQAFYSNLPPHDYRFRVVACNNSGVWNEAGASLSFSIAPAYYQSMWFRLLCLAGLLAILWGIYHFRMRQFAWQFNMRIEERVNERTRLARELHDTMLQSFQAVLLRLHALSYLLPDRPAEAAKSLEGVADLASQAIDEGRSAVQGLRASTVITNDLARSIDVYRQTLTAELSVPDGDPGPEFNLQVEGATRDLVPLVRDEVHRIACEAIRNAFRHSQAKRIDVKICYFTRQFQIGVQDNGMGIDAKILSEGGRAGHHGLPGMRERARLIGGRLEISSRPGLTQVRLAIPASNAYARKTASNAMSMFSGKGT